MGARRAHAPYKNCLGETTLNGRAFTEARTMSGTHAPTPTPGVEGASGGAPAGAYSERVARMCFHDATSYK